MKNLYDKYIAVRKRVQKSRNEAKFSRELASILNEYYVVAEKYIDGLETGRADKTFRTMYFDTLWRVKKMLKRHYSLLTENKGKPMSADQVLQKRRSRSLEQIRKDFDGSEVQKGRPKNMERRNS